MGRNLVFLFLKGINPKELSEHSTSIIDFIVLIANLLIIIKNFIFHGIENNLTYSH